MPFYILIFCVLIQTFFMPLEAKDKTIGVFVALADNESQGIVPVPKEIGNGDDPERNLYWGTADGLKSVFGKSKEWKLLETQESLENKDILRLMVFINEKKSAMLTAKAYKGSAIKQCLQDYELALRRGDFDLVVYIGHNGLMDFDLDIQEKLNEQKKKPDCIVLCCKSEAYFASRIEKIGGRPILLTRQFMYPGAFILHAVLDAWLENKNLTTIRQSAGDSYANNQKISKKAGLGVFSDLKE